MGLLSKIHELKQAAGAPIMLRQPSNPAIATHWTIIEVNDWLRREELGMYSSLFNRRKINGPALLRMRDADLSLLGVKVRRLDRQRRGDGHRTLHTGLRC